MTEPTTTQEVPPRVVEFLRENQTMTLATASPNGIPRATTLRYVSDDLDLYDERWNGPVRCRAHAPSPELLRRLRDLRRHGQRQRHAHDQRPQQRVHEPADRGEGEGVEWMRAIQRGGEQARDLLDEQRDLRPEVLDGAADVQRLTTVPEQPAARALGQRPHIFNLGHGILPQTPVESVAALVDEVRAYSRQQRSTGSASP